MGQLNIKDEALIADAKALAELLGTSATGAMREAVRERLERERRSRDRERKIARIEELAARIRENAGGRLMTNPELDAFLYDPGTGLPR